MEPPDSTPTTIAPQLVAATPPQPPLPIVANASGGGTQDALGEIAREIGNQALDMLDAMIKSEHVQERLKQSMTPIVQSLVEAAATHDAEIRGHFNKIMKPYSDQYMFVLYAGGGMAISVIVLLLVTVIMLFSVRVRVSRR